MRADPYQHFAVFVCGDALRLDELFLKRLQVLVVQMKLELEGAIGDPPAGPQQGHDLVQYLIKVHHWPSESASSSALASCKSPVPKLSMTRRKNAERSCAVLCLTAAVRCYPMRAARKNTWQQSVPSLRPRF